MTEPGALAMDPRMPPPEECVLRPLLERRAAATPEQPFALFADGTCWTYRDMREQACMTAHALRALGVGQGDSVLVWLPNGPDMLRLWFGLNYLGASFVPINLAYRGQLLEHVVRVSDAKLIVLHAQRLDRLAEIDTGPLSAAVVIAGDPTLQVPGLALHTAQALLSAQREPPPLARAIAPWDTQTIIYTSGTTGPSKGVLQSYAQVHAQSFATWHWTAADRFLVNLPLFHVGGTFPTYGMLIRGGSIAVVERFKMARFWQTVRDFGITTIIVLGSMASFLLNQPASDRDRDHPLRTVTMVPYGETSFRFAERFGCAVYTHYNMTEISMPIVSGPNPGLPGVAGQSRAGVELRIVDENDCEVPAGQVGELIVRTDCPWTMTHGYAKAPEATARAWRNGWFHTGDAFRRDPSGHYFFVDRMKDAIRRRGENISSFEVESELSAYPAVREAAVIAHPSEHGEDEVLAVLTLREDTEFDPIDLIGFLVPRMPHYMVPRYVLVVPELPRTPTQKIQKHVLRDLAAGAALWDREAAGIMLRGDRLTSPR